ncbi:MAG: hypothetical protein HY554_19230, partial [Elusimicrobia bacterium]|nr:hypothetical protein [Elusimicrobiota bacterium]
MWAAVPQFILYQGKLADSTGNPLSGTFSFRFKFFAQATGGTPLFTEQLSGGNAVTVVNGIYTV